MEIAATVIAATAALAAVASAWISYRQKELAKTSANDARGDATAARESAERAAGAAEESANAHSRLASIAEAQASRPPWKITQTGDHNYVAVNEGLTDLFDVKVSVSGFMSDRESSAEVVQRGASIHFFAAATMQEPSVAVTFTWSDEPGGANHEWTDRLC